MKKFFTAPEVEVVTFDAKDVITTSNCPQDSCPLDGTWCDGDDCVGIYTDTCPSD